jgi:hypothetical protein
MASPSSPARCRTAIGRAYYGAFHSAVDILKRLNAPPGKGPSAHGHAFRLLQRSGDLELAAAGMLLQSLHGLRIIADYALDPRPVVETPANARKAAADADRIVAALDELMADATRRSHAEAAIRVTYQGVTGVPPP